MIKFTPFDPNSEDRYNWATYVPNRNPPFKVHELKSHALIALKQPYTFTNSWKTDKDGFSYRIVNPGVTLYTKGKDNLWKAVLFKREYRDGESLII